MGKGYIIWLLLPTILVLSFKVDHPTKEALIQEALYKRVEDYKNELLSKCKDKAKRDAEVMVDSIIAIELGAGPIDTLDFPAKPQRPSFEPYDSLVQEDVDLKPLFDQSEIN